MSRLKTSLPTNTWVTASWNDYLRFIEDPAYETAKGYYYQEHMRIEMSPVGFDHGKDHTILIFAINLFTAIKGIPITMVDTTTHRKAGLQECQPDIACYVREKAQVIPTGTNIINLNQYPPPDLVVEVAKTSLIDDLGTKRSLYETLGVAEYWIVDVENTQLLAYAISDRGSLRIDVSQVLPGLLISTLTEALHRSRQTDQSQVGTWLIDQFQKPED